MRTAALTLLFASLGVLLTARGYAKPDFPNIVAKQYTLKAGGVVEKASKSCALCHAAVPKLNPYGADLKAALKAAQAKTLTPAVWQAVATKDSDGDGATNEAEIQADTLPADPNSKPAGATSAAGTTTATPSAQPAAPTAEPSPWDIKGAITAKHAQHPVIVHFPIALFIISFLFDFLGSRKRNAGLLTAGFYNLCIAAASAPMAVISGLLAWQIKFGGAKLEGALLQHLLLGIVTTSMLLALVGMRRPRRHLPPEEEINTAYLVLAVLSVICIALTGHLGGYLVFGA